MISFGRISGVLLFFVSGLLEYNTNTKVQILHCRIILIDEALTFKH